MVEEAASTAVSALRPDALAGRAVLVVGMARSGRAAAALAHALGASVTTTDLREVDPVPGCRAVHGRHDEADFLGADLVIVSPGVPARAPLLRAAVDAGVTVVGELGWAAGLLADLPTAAVTGTNGKSSTVHFLGRLLAAAGRRPFVGGNLGTPLSTLALARLRGEQADVDCLVLEVSSYQLELPGDLRPAAAAVLNLTPDHLARHGDMAGYAAAKRVLVERTDVAWLAADGGWVEGMAAGPRAGEVRWLGRQPGVTWTEEALTFADEATVGLTGLSVLGPHNRANVAAACALARALGVDAADLDPSVLTALPHRLQVVAERDGRRWIDDSKATNVDAALVGIRGVPGPQIVLLGGQGKDGADYGALLPALDRARAVVCFGASGPEIHAAVGGILAESLAEAVDLARILALPGDSILLSPACASFDEFSDFEARGRAFAAWAAQTPGGPK
ncbi:MAG: UDP-N-acetylmuramoyl-L-alanine--D-glutamate ligase [Alphaproteobacteria bacterium]|nr:UDP-N-acetylmuramoyl-L-alanine--D-glutamate ligase [Alphaproteobacteria bacterium]